MSKIRDAAQKVLDDLEDAAEEWSRYVVEDTAHCTLLKHLEPHINAIRAALAEQPAEQEPVAWWHRKSNTFTSGNLVSNFAEWAPLYAAPQPRRRLTDEEIIRVAVGTKSAEPGRDGYILPITFARAIEAAVWGEKT